MIDLHLNAMYQLSPCDPPLVLAPGMTMLALRLAFTRQLGREETGMFVFHSRLPFDGVLTVNCLLNRTLVGSGSPLLAR